MGSSAGRFATLHQSMHRLSLGWPARLQLLDRPDDPPPHRARVGLADGQKISGARRSLVRSVAPEALRHERGRAPDVDVGNHRDC
jgi:hypothetical protein